MQATTKFNLNLPNRQIQSPNLVQHDLKPQFCMPEFHYIIKRWESERRRRHFAIRLAKGVSNHHTVTLADSAVDDLTRNLVALGLHVAPTRHKAKIDMLVSDSTGRTLAIEVKASTFKRRADLPAHGRYQARLKPGQRLAADVICLGCLTSSGWCWFIIPAGKVSGMTLNITRQDPQDYSGKYRQFLHNFEIISHVMIGGESHE